MSDNINNALKDLREKLTEWRGCPCLKVDFKVDGSDVEIHAYFIRGAGQE
jgi:hypothetical protein